MTSCGTEGQNSTTAVRKGILLPVVPKYDSPGAHLDSMFVHDVPMQLFGVRGTAPPH